MNEEEQYRRWLEYRNDARGHADCSQAVMRAIAAAPPAPELKNRMARLGDWLSGASDRMTWAFGVAMALLGLSRVCAITMTLLVP